MADERAIAVGTGANLRSRLNNAEIRGVVYQILLVLVLAGAVWWFVGNTVDNLRRANIASGFGFLNGRAGFDISATLIPFSSDSTYGRALVVGILNMLLVAGMAIVASTIVGFLIGIGRLSNNWLVAKLATGYVEIFRNIPPLLIVFFWYVGVISLLPQVRQALSLPLSVFISNRGISMPRPVFGAAATPALVGLVVAIVAGLAIAWFARRRQIATGQRFPAFWTAVALVVVLPVGAVWTSGASVTFDLPNLGRFRLEGGMTIGPEFLSLFLSLSSYTAAYIAEIVRSGILGVSGGQTEAAHALGISPGLTLRLVVIPQALRIMIPPLTSQYLNLIKDTSMAIAVGYSDLVSIGGTIMNQTGQAIEVITIWVVVYLSVSLAASSFMNWFNRRVALVER
jgi:general L-amino acid transport system permease protein